MPRRDIVLKNKVHCGNNQNDLSEILSILIKVLKKNLEKNTIGKTKNMVDYDYREFAEFACALNLNE